MQFLSFQQWRSPLKPIRLMLLIVGITCLSACSASNANPEQSKSAIKKAVPVTIATVTQASIPVQIQVIGNVQARNTVTVRAQVGGQLTGVYFRQGERVRRGQLLFTIDDRPLQASLQQAQANLAKDIAQIKQAQANLTKDIAQQQYAQSQARSYASLGNEGAISKLQATQYITGAQAADATVAADRAAVQNAQAAVNADKAAVENAQVQLSYTKIYSPIDGQAGTVVVDRGNLIQSNSTNPLVTISQIQPIQVAFSVPEKELPAIRQYMANSRLGLQVSIPNSKQSVAGVLAAVNGVVDNTTGTIQLLGDFTNSQEQLWPGQFVNVTLNLTTIPNATVVPSQAVQTGQNGQSVFVLSQNNTAQLRAVTVSRTFNGQAVIDKGVQPGEKVVTDGQFNLVPGAKVQVKTTPVSGGSTS